MERSLWKEWKAGGIRFVGGSIAGVGTCFHLPELDLCLDVANGPNESMNAKKYLITHGHTDHAGGIPYILSQKALNKLPPPEMYMPEIMIEPLTEIMKLWMKIEGHAYGYNFIPIRGGETIELKGDYFFRPFPTVHRIPSFGYTVFRRHKKLKSEFRNRTEGEIIGLKKQGIVIDEFFEEPLVSYTGDTKIEVWDMDNYLKKSKVAIIEVTYVDEKKPVSEARKWGHIHLDEILPKVESFEGETLVMIHQSRRYSPKDFQKIIYSRLPEHLRSRVMAAPYA